MVLRRQLARTLSTLRLLPLDVRENGRCTYCDVSHKQTALRHVDLIKELTGAPERDILDRLMKVAKIQGLSEADVRHALTKLKELGIKHKFKADIIRLLNVHPVTVQNRTMVLREAGFSESKITVAVLLRYLFLSKLKVEELKSRKYIEVDVDVADRMATYLNVPRTDLDPEIYSESNSLMKMRLDIIRKYLENTLSLTNEKFLKNRWYNKRMKHKSLWTIKQNVHLAQNVLGMSVSRVRNNPFLLALNPENTLEILDKLGDIGGVHIRHAIITHPKILASPVDNLLKIKNHLKNYHISNEAITKCIEIYTLNSDTVLGRLEELKRNEFFSVCLPHPRILELIMYQKKAIKRLGLLSDQKFKCTTLNTISSPQKLFEKFLVVGGMERPPSGSDILHFLTKEFNEERMALQKKLRRHPYWTYVPLVFIARNLTTLRQLGFTDDQILKDLHILLYPMEKLICELEAIAKEEKPELDCCRTEEGHVRQDLQLQLAIYYIEKEFNFNGEAIWADTSSLHTND